MAVGIALPGSSGLLSQSAQVNRYMGMSVRETAGAVAVMRLREGAVTGKIVEDVSLLANESARDWYGPQGRVVNGDIYYQIVSGTIEGTIFVE